MNIEKLVLNYLILSVIAAVLILALAWSFSINTMQIDLLEKYEVGLLFIFCCFIGISMVMKPNWIHVCIEQQTHGNEDHKAKTKSTNTGRVRKKRLGHHPDCGRFRNHTIRFNNKVFCAGCTGLAIGAGLAVFLMVLVLTLPINPSKNILFAFLILGLVLIAFNFASTMHETTYAKAKLLSNVLLVLGFFLVSTGIFMLTGALIFGIFGIMVCILWLDTRILLSKHNHQYICEKCNIKCTEYNID